jgi:mannosylglycerate hydrolase
MKRLHIVSHTHWDREWYLTFQQFRLKLVNLVDGLLEILESDRDFRTFLLDGQTIVLDDYLQIRPEMRKRIRKYVRKGRIQIGPWHILPDMFLVGPEAHIRNLLQGDRTARKFGPKMRVGYIPDPFGHPGQVPQILRGFGIKIACVWRGLGDQPVEFWWESPDGSRVLMAYMRDSYSNGAGLATAQPERFTEQLSLAQESLASASATRDHLIMLGTDHMAPSPDTTAAIAYADQHLLETRVLHSSLPKYVKAIRKQVAGQNLPVQIGELRECKNSPLLPGVLSTRMWIKQRNHASETLLAKWVEPFSTFADQLRGGGGAGDSISTMQSKNGASLLIQDPAALTRYAWRLLMENHPHDSICGCSIDQVHAEMRSRFDQVDQIGEEVTHQSLQTVAAMVNTQSTTYDTPTIGTAPAVSGGNGSQEAASAIVVFNPGDTACTGPVEVTVEQTGRAGSFEIFDGSGSIITYKSQSMDQREIINMILDRKGLQDGLSTVHDGLIAGMAVQEMTLDKVGEQVTIRMTLSETGAPNLKAWRAGLEKGRDYLEDPEVLTFHVLARSAVSPQVRFIASEVPPHGWKTYWMRCVEVQEQPPAEIHPMVKPFLPLAMRLAGTRMGERMIQALTAKKAEKSHFVIENEYFRVEANPDDGTLTLHDNRTGAVYRGHNRFEDGGDAGDEYNYSPPERDNFITAEVQSIRVHQHAVEQGLEISYRLVIPERVTPDRTGRTEETVILPIRCHVRVVPGLARIDIETEVENPAKDHRLRVHFPALFPVDYADYDSHFEVVRRPVGTLQREDNWVEDPRPEVPQRAFVDISNGEVGLMVANRGLPEVEVLRNAEGNGEIVLTLLRCVEWLSRDDLKTRDGHAGPNLYTPDAQMSGKWRFEYSIIPHAGDWFTAHRLALDFQSPLRAISSRIHAGTLPSSGSFLKVSPEAFAISAVKTSEDGRGWLVRGTNLIAEPIEVRLTPFQPFRKAELVNLAEKRVRKLKPAVDGTITFLVRGCQIVSVVFRN